MKHARMFLLYVFLLGLTCQKGNAQKTVTPDTEEIDEESKEEATTQTATDKDETAGNDVKVETAGNDEKDGDQESREQDINEASNEEVAAPAVIINEKCRRHEDCYGDLGVCMRDSSMCYCDNGQSNYPACGHQQENKERCGAECNRKNGFCSSTRVNGTTTYGCMCINGGRWPDHCCATTCGSGETCHLDKCVCMYGPRPDGNGCSLCPDMCDLASSVCDENEVDPQCKCKNGGTFPECLQIDCAKYCGRGSQCKKANGNAEVECTSCAKELRLKDGKCFFLGKWTQWSSCSATCGPGVRTRRRTCRPGQKRCYPSGLVKKQCNAGKCQEPWRKWSQWSSCLATCGPSTQLRKRTCAQPEKCPNGNAFDMRACNQSNCTSEVSVWSAWGRCPVTCGAGTQSRHRHCITDDTFPCKQKLSETRNCPDIHPCPCGWCDWKETAKRYTKDCLQVETDRHREPYCPAYQPPGKNCTGDANDIQQSPPVPGRQQEINKATMMTCSFAKTTATTRFNITCLGGCTNIISARFDCHGRDNLDVTKMVVDFCGGKEVCDFKPDAKFFGLEHLGCTALMASVKLSCVGGKVIKNHVGQGGRSRSWGR